MRDAWISPAIGTRIGKSGGQLTRDAMMKELDLGNKGRRGVSEGCGGGAAAMAVETRETVQSSSATRQFPSGEARLMSAGGLAGPVSARLGACFDFGGAGVRGWLVTLLYSSRLAVSPPPAACSPRKTAACPHQRAASTGRGDTDNGRQFVVCQLDTRARAFVSTNF